MSVNDFAQLTEEIRQDEMKALWQRFGGLVLVLVLAVIVGTAIWTGVEAYQTGQREKATGQLASVLDLEPSARAAKLTGMVETPVGTIARLTLIGDALEAGNTDAARKEIAALADDKDSSEFYRQMAVILEARLALDGTGKDGTAALAKLKKLAEDVNTPWGPQAVFYKAVIEMRAAGDVKEIRRIADDAGKKLAGDQALLRQLTSLENLYLADRPID
jgi:hypothetical protein